MILALTFWLLHLETEDFDFSEHLPMKIIGMVVFGYSIIIGVTLDIGLVRLLWKLCA